MAGCRGGLRERRVAAGGDEGLEGEVAGCWEGEGVDHGEAKLVIEEEEEDQWERKVDVTASQEARQRRVAVCALQQCVDYVSVSFLEYCLCTYMCWVIRVVSSWPIL